MDFLIWELYTAHNFTLYFDFLSNIFWLPSPMRLKEGKHLVIVVKEMLRIGRSIARRKAVGLLYQSSPSGLSTTAGFVERELGQNGN